MARKGKRRATRPKGSPSASYNKSGLSRAITPSKLSDRSFSARDRSLHAWRDMQRGASFSKAARDNGLTYRTFKRYLATGLRQDRPGGRIYATKSHRVSTILQIPVLGPNGHPIEKEVHGSKEASEWARFKRDVNRLLAGNSKALDEWHGKSIGGVKLVTAGRTLKAWADKGLLPYSLYRSFNGGAS